MNSFRNSILVCSLLATAATSQATIWQFSINATGGQVVPSNGSSGTGPGTLTYNDATNLFQLNMTMSGISANNSGQITATQLYSGAAGTNGPLIDDLSVLCNWNGAGGNFTLFAPVFYNLNQSFENALLSGNAYLVVKTAEFPGGEIRGQFNAVPEPATICALALGSLLLRRRKRA